MKRQTKHRNQKNTKGTTLMYELEKLIATDTFLNQFLCFITNTSNHRTRLKITMQNPDDKFNPYFFYIIYTNQKYFVHNNFETMLWLKRKGLKELDNATKEYLTSLINENCSLTVTNKMNFSQTTQNINVIPFIITEMIYAYELIAKKLKI